MVERFRVKNDLLVSEIDEMDWVEHDEVLFVDRLNYFTVDVILLTATTNWEPKLLLEIR